MLDQLRAHLTPAAEVAAHAARSPQDPRVVDVRRSTYPWRLALDQLLTAEVVVEAVGELLDLDGATVMDAGCGPGLIARRLADSGAHVLAVDRSDEMLDAADELVDAHPAVRFEQVDVLEEPGARDYDVVLCGDVPTSPSVLSALRSWVRPDGWLVVKRSGLSERVRTSWDPGLDRRAAATVGAGLRTAAGYPPRPPDWFLTELLGHTWRERRVSTRTVSTVGPLPLLWSAVLAERFATFEGPFLHVGLEPQDREAWWAAMDPLASTSVHARRDVLCLEPIVCIAVRKGGDT